MENTASKMDWFVKMYNEKKLDYTIAKTKANFGAIVMPTGTGKSGKVYEDICNIIDNHQKGQKTVINISCPILKLTQQFITDFFSIAAQIYAGTEFTFFINSSDNGNNYNKALQVMDVDIENFSAFEKKFINNPNADIAIVASCHKSLYKFINKIAKLNTTGINIVSYIDEAHLIDIHKNNEDQDVIYVDIDKLCAHSNKVYAFTATPDQEVVDVINRHNLTLTNGSKYIYHMRPVEAIANNIIVPPYVNYIRTKTDGISVKLLDKIMKDTKANVPHIAHKVLVTLKSAEELKSVRNELDKMGYTVFSTCSQFGYGNGEEDTDEKYKDVTEFINDIDSYNGDCFVLHIRQLIQGIDIKSLTDCVIWSANNGNQKEYRHLIQIIGRCLRTLSDERGMTKELRKKKNGRVYFISPADNEGVQDNISNFICRYYGFDNIDFAVKEYNRNGLTEDDMFDIFKDIKYPNGWDNPEVTDLLINIEEYVKTKLVPKIKLYKRLGKKLDIMANATSILMEYDAMGKEWNTTELLDNKDLLDKIREIFERYDVYNNGVTTELF